MSGNILLEKMSIYCSNDGDAYLLLYGKRREGGLPCLRRYAVNK